MTETNPVRQPHSNPVDSTHVKAADGAKRQARGGGDSHNNGWRPDQVTSKLELADSDHPKYATAEKLRDRIISQVTRTAEPSDKYARRPRHKTKEDRYEVKEKPERRTRRSHSERRLKGKPKATLNEDFKAPNIAAERLTLKPAGPGFLSKGKTSGNAEWKGLPDLTFSEMTFLKRKRADDDVRFQKLDGKDPKKTTCKPPGAEISEFFSRPPDETARGMSTARPLSTSPYVSWSVSQLPESRRAACVAHSVGPGSTRNEEREHQSGPSSIRPKSSVSNRLLKELTRDALLRDVDASSKRRKRYYSLEELKVLAEEIGPHASHHLNSRHNFSSDPRDDHKVIPMVSFMPEALVPWEHAANSSRAEEAEPKRNPAVEWSDPPTQRQVRSRAALPEQQQYQSDVAHSYRLDEIDRTPRRLGEVQRQLTPHVMRSIPQSSLLQQPEFDEGLSEIPLSFGKLHVPNHYVQPVWQEEETWTDPALQISPGRDQSEDGLIYAEQNVDVLEDTFEKGQITSPLREPGLCRPSEDTELVQDDGPPSNELDEFDRDLLWHAAEECASSEWVYGADRNGRMGDDDTYLRPPQEMDHHWTQSGGCAQDDQQQVCESIQVLHEVPNVGQAFQDMPEALERPHHRVISAVGEFSGYTRRQILY